MKTRFTSILFIAVCTGFALFFSAGCRKNITIRERVYFEDGEDGVASNIQAYTGQGYPITGLVKPFGGTNIIGTFNNSRIYLEIDTLPSHNMIYVQFDLYTHDRWEGFRKGMPGIVDVVNVLVDESYQLVTNFSNVRSQPQAYPEWTGIGYENISRGNAIDTLLPGFCLWEDKPNGSSRYRVAFSRPHTAKNVLIEINDAAQGSWCEKSWSVDNLLIEAITN